MEVSKSISHSPPHPDPVIGWLLLPFLVRFHLIFASEDFPDLPKSSLSLSNISWCFVREGFQGI